MCLLFNRFPLEAVKMCETHQVKVIKSDKSVGILHYKSFNNNVSIDFICIRFANIVFMYGRCFD